MAKVHMLLPSGQKPGCLPDQGRHLCTSVPSTQAYALGDWTCYKEALERHQTFKQEISPKDEQYIPAEE